MSSLEFEEESINLVKSRQNKMNEKTSFSSTSLLVKSGLCKDYKGAQTLLVIMLLLSISVLFYLLNKSLLDSEVKQIPFEELPIEEQLRQSQTDYSARPEIF